MAISLEQYLAIAVILIFGSFIQSVVGFAFGLVSIPLLVVVGIPIQYAIACVLTATFVQSLLGVKRLWSDIDMPSVLYAGITRALFVPIGVLLMNELTLLEPRLIKVIIGCFVLFIVILEISAHKKFSQELSTSKYVSFSAFALSGFCSGAVGMGGPFLVVWLMAQRWSSKRSRAFLFSTFTFIVPVQLFILYFFYGRSILEVVLYTLLFSPVLIGVSVFGFSLGDKLPAKRLRHVAYSLLLVISITSIVTNF